VGLRRRSPYTTTGALRQQLLPPLGSGRPINPYGNANPGYNGYNYPNGNAVPGYGNPYGNPYPNNPPPRTKWWQQLLP